MKTLPDEIEAEKINQEISAYFKKTVETRGLFKYLCDTTNVSKVKIINYLEENGFAIHYPVSFQQWVKEVNV